jgi:Protein of unknown function (DUF3224)
MRPTVAALALAGALLLAAGPAAAAGPPIAASGSFVQDSFVQSNIRSAGGVTLFDFTEHDTLSGTFGGTSVIEGSCAVQASGRGQCRGVETFTGDVAGQAGTAVFHDVITLEPTGASHGRFTITGGSLNVRGQGTFQGTGTSGTYTGLLVIGP